MFPINKFEFFGAALALSTSLFCSCASSEKSANSSAVASVSELTPVRVQLDWIYNAQFAGLFQAVEQGYYADVGFEVSCWSSLCKRVIRDVQPRPHGPGHRRGTSGATGAISFLDALSTASRLSEFHTQPDSHRCWLRGRLLGQLV